MPINAFSPKFVFYSLIPELKEESGHHVHYHSSIQRGVDGLGGQFVALMHKNCRITTLSSEWQNWFRRRGKPKYFWRDLFFLFLDFSKVFRKKEEKKRIFFLDSFTQVELISFLLAAIFFARKNDAVWLLFRYYTSKKEMVWQGRWCSLANRILKSRFLLLSDSDLLRDQLRKEFRTKIFYLPHYIFTPPEGDLQSDKIECSWLGGPRVEKGLKSIESLIFSKDEEASKFRLSVSELMKVDQMGPLELRKFPYALTRESYEEEFKRTQVMFLPYEESVYRYRTSGIFIEAILGGKIPLVKGGTWSAHQLKEHGLEELIIDWGNPHFFRHLSQLIDHKEIRKKLEVMREEYKKLHSDGSLRSYLEKLID